MTPDIALCTAAAALLATALILNRRRRPAAVHGLDTCHGCGDWHLALELSGGRCRECLLRDEMDALAAADAERGR